ncbi:FG-GAP-like repeat-containing protein [uncultured Draconibacterium sp.]|uniref:FG-GAP-like repeat-containing protein n=1 Tax=uncultured Draconibacterium sp. TaxID=1573823 RepID=UPI0032167F2D
MEKIRTPHIHEKSSEMTIMIKKTNFRLFKIVIALILILSVHIGNGQTTDYFTVIQYEELNIGQGALIDFNNDGYLDFVGGYQESDSVAYLRALFNDGTSTFSDATTEILGSDPVKLGNPGSQFLVEDFNGDGLVDLFVGDMGYDYFPFPGAQNRIFIQTEDGRLSDETELRLPQVALFTHSEVAGDIDGDGDIDIVLQETIGNVEIENPELYQTATTVYLNDGKGYFERNDDIIPDYIAQPWNDEAYLTYALFDSDNDSDLDLYCGTNSKDYLYGPSQARSILLINDGDTNYTMADTTYIPKNRRDKYMAVNQPNINIADVDNNGWLDIMEVRVFEDYSSLSSLTLLLNKGDGRFFDASYLIANNEGADLPSFADFNNDGFMDIIAMKQDENGCGGFKIYMNRANTEFVEISNELELDLNSCMNIYPGDLDNDGKTDLFITGFTHFFSVKNNKIYDILSNHPLSTPDVPSLLFPLNKDTVSVTTRLKWDRADLASDYNLQISSSSSFENLLLDTTNVLPNYYGLINLTEDQEYFWRVRASNITGVSSWSDIRSFKHVNRPPTSISLSTATVNRESKAGTIVSLLNVEDPDEQDTFTFSLTQGDGENDTDNEKFIIQGDTLILKTNLTSEDTLSLMIHVNVNDGSHSINQALTIEVTSLLVAFYPFNGNANDESSNDNNGIVNGAVLTTDRNNATDRAYSFDGINDNIELGRGSNLINDAESFTITSWIYPYEQSDDTQFTILSERLEGENYQFAISDNDLYFSYWNEGQEHAVEVQKNSIAPGIWQFVAVTYSNDTLRFYVDGELNLEKNISVNIDNHNSTLFIGSYNGTEAMFNGKLDDISVYNCCLSKEQINLLMAQTIVTSSNSLIASEKSFKVFPNPTNGFINIEFDSFSSAKTLLEIFNLHGQRIYMEEYYPISTIKRIEVSTLSKGVYFLKISNSMRQQAEKIIIDK